MTWTEFLIVYLSIGAPFGVYYFLDHRARNFDLALLPKTCAAAVFWWFYAFSLISPLSAKFTTIKTASDVSKKNKSENEIEQTLRKLLAAYSETKTSRASIPFFDFRETAERYIGLTTALRDAANGNGEFQNELFTIAGRNEEKDLQLANLCLQRRNLRHLKQHQRRATNDFLTVFENFADEFSENTVNENLLANAQKLAVLLDDVESQKALQQISAETKNRHANRVLTAKSEKERWNSLPNEPVQVLQTQSSTLNLAVKAQD